MDELLDKLTRLNEAYASRIEYSMKLEEELRLTRKALLVACLKYGYATQEEEDCPETEEEAQAITIYNTYTRPKKLAKQMIKLAKTRYDSETNIALKFWDTEVGNEQG